MKEKGLEGVSMTVVVAGAKNEFGFIAADTRLMIENGPVPFLDRAKKIYYHEQKNMFSAGAGDAHMVERFNEILEESNICTPKDILKCYCKTFEEYKYNSGFSIFIAACTNKNIRKLYTEVEMEKNTICMLQINDFYRVILPGDIANEVGVSYVEHDIVSEDPQEILLDALDKFMRLSQRSNFVSDTCNIVVWTEDAVLYYEEKIKDIISCLKKGKLPENKIDKLNKNMREQVFDVVY